MKEVFELFEGMYWSGSGLNRLVNQKLKSLRFQMAFTNKTEKKTNPKIPWVATVVHYLQL